MVVVVVGSGGRRKVSFRREKGKVKCCFWVGRDR